MRPAWLGLLGAGLLLLGACWVPGTGLVLAQAQLDSDDRLTPRGAPDSRRRFTLLHTSNKRQKRSPPSVLLDPRESAR